MLYVCVSTCLPTSLSPCWSDPPSEKADTLAYGTTNKCQVPMMTSTGAWRVAGPGWIHRGMSRCDHLWADPTFRWPSPPLKHRHCWYIKQDWGEEATKERSSEKAGTEPYWSIQPIIMQHLNNCLIIKQSKCKAKAVLEENNLARSHQTNAVQFSQYTKGGGYRDESTL